MAPMQQQPVKLDLAASNQMTNTDSGTSLTVLRGSTMDQTMSSDQPQAEKQHEKAAGVEQQQQQQPSSKQLTKKTNSDEINQQLLAELATSTNAGKQPQGRFVQAASFSSPSSLASSRTVNKLSLAEEGEQPLPTHYGQLNPLHQDCWFCCCECPVWVGLLVFALCCLMMFISFFFWPKTINVSYAEQNRHGYMNYHDYDSTRV